MNWKDELFSAEGESPVLNGSDLLTMQITLILERLNGLSAEADRELTLMRVSGLEPRAEQVIEKLSVGMRKIIEELA